MFVPVLSSDGKPLMPTKPSRARRLLVAGKAKSFFSHGVFCIRLTTRPDGDTQPIAVGVDPGSKREAYTVKSESHTFLNVLSDAVTWVKDAIESKRNARRSRRQRKTPCRANRINRKRGGLPPSTKARWQLKLNVCKWLAKLFPVSAFVVEDVKAVARKGNGDNWNANFSPLAAGKKWLYENLWKLGRVELKSGFETFELREQHGLKKSGNKLAKAFSAHNVDSWVLANQYVGGHVKPDNKALLLLTPIQLHRRQLHVFQFSKGGIRRSYGGTRSMGFKRGSLARHPKFGLTYVGGTSNNRISLHSIETGKRLTQSARPEQTSFVCYSSWRTRNDK